ncbi:MAG TPA: type II CAAX endopeptidase family protein [Candidatus Acidoferrum sp.]|nr:type II CAAX endopeptidase family protein [Candidatus Acidoferrum sp.]
MDEGKPIEGIEGQVGEIPALSEPPRRQNVVFFGDKGLRSGWRLLIYIAIVSVLAGVITLLMVRIFGEPRGVPPVSAMILQEVVGFAVVFGAAVVMSRVERRSVGKYGLPAREIFSGKFWLGFLFGLAEISVLIGLIAAFGGYSFGSFALRGNEILRWGLIHLVLFTFVGFFEEFLFRGYTQFTLGDGIGFWPAAILLSVGFGVVHLGNPGEGWVGAAGVVLVGAFFCFTLRRTGNLWYAVGLHASFDWGETFLYSVPNSGVVMQGHLSNAVLHGPKWLTGASVGPEGSVFCFVTMGLQFLVVMLLFPKKEAERATEIAGPAD